MGAFRFKYNGTWLGEQAEDQAVPPISSMDAFIREAHEIEKAETGKGYMDIADAIVGDMGISHPADNLAELYRRVAFNIATATTTTISGTTGSCSGKMVGSCPRRTT